MGNYKWLGIKNIKPVLDFPKILLIYVHLVLNVIASRFSWWLFITPVLPFYSWFDMLEIENIPENVDQQSLKFTVPNWLFCLSIALESYYRVFGGSYHLVLWTCWKLESLKLCFIVVLCFHLAIPCFILLNFIVTANINSEILAHFCRLLVLLLIPVPSPFFLCGDTAFSSSFTIFKIFIFFQNLLSYLGLAPVLCSFIYYYFLLGVCISQQCIQFSIRRSFCIFFMCAVSIYIFLSVIYWGRLLVSIANNNFVIHTVR